MKTLKFVMFILYRYYSKGGTRDIPYFSSLCAIVLLIYLHIFQVLILLDKVDEVLPMKSDDERGIKYFKLAVFLLPVFLVVAFLVKPRDLKDMQYDEQKVKWGGIYLILYAISSFTLLFVLILLKR